MTPAVERLGLVPVKGLSWNSPDRIEVQAGGVTGDRLWSPVTSDLRCIRATDHPSMVGVGAGSKDLPTVERDVLFQGAEQIVHYYTRRVPARIFGGRLAEHLSEAAGQRLLLARAGEPGSFLWSSPVSVLLRSELPGLPGDVDRYRANVVIDDRDAPLKAVPGSRLVLGEVVLRFERELDRCVVINHHPVTGHRDASLLKRLRPGALLGYGCKVLRAGPLGVGAPATMS